MGTLQLPPNKHQERSLRTRALLLDAAIKSLAEVGYVNASTSDIASRAGVTRGAHLHHFKTRTELFAQTIDHLNTRQQDAVQRVAEAATDTSAPAEMIVELVVAAFAGELGRASVELFVAIRNDEALRQHMLQVQRGLTQELLQVCAELIGTNAPAQRLEPTFWMTLNLVRGTIVDEMLGRNASRRKQMLAEWKRLASVSLQDVDSTRDAAVNRHE
ncbi:TetR/AcrR family transcriptional regulator [Mycobacterium sp. NPDC051804]|uniref:TetR/AcrR family transcriptional regulator n=1 Tax=Mycobacterium sp. NPDC051804 TaxID=3364295 RepID=UPI00378B73BF